MRPRCRGYLLILATVLLALICGCGPRKAATRDQGITLQFWNGFSGPDGFGVAKLPKALSRALRVPETARNWRTVLKLLELAQTR